MAKFAHFFNELSCHPHIICTYINKVQFKLNFEFEENVHPFIEIIITHSYIPCASASQFTVTLFQMCEFSFRFFL